MNTPVDSPASMSLEQGFQLGAVRILPRAGEATGPGGREKLDARVMDVLVMLAQHPGQVVLREDLLARLWPNAVVSDEVLSRCIYELRKQLTQAGGGEQYKEIIETVTKRGYRLNADVTPIQPTGDPQRAVNPRRRQLAMAAAIGIAVVLAIVVGRFIARPSPDSRAESAATRADSVAVLPFVDMSERKDQGYLSDGISEEILNRLAQQKDLRVISRTSSFSFRDRPLDIPEIAATLKVSHVLEGSVRRSGDKVRITAQLIAVSTDSHLWSATYDRALDDLFAVQDEIADAVAAALQVKLSEGSRMRPVAIDGAAHERFLQGQYFYRRRAPGDFRLAAKYFEEAVVLDPGYARAWAALAGAMRILFLDSSSADKNLQRRQGEAALKAVELDPQLAVAQARLSEYYTEIRDPTKATEHYLKAIALDPEDPLILGWTSFDAYWRGDTDVAVEMMRRSVARDPLNTVIRHNLGVLLTATGRLDEAMSEFRKSVELSPDSNLESTIEIPRILVLQGRYAEARSAVDKLPAGKHRDHGRALLYRMPGQLEAADAALGRLSTQTEDIIDSIRLAEVYAFRGMKDKAFVTLQAKKDLLAMDDMAIQLITNLRNEALVSPFLKPLHADPRWAVLMTQPG